MTANIVFDNKAEKNTEEVRRVGRITKSEISTVERRRSREQGRTYVAIRQPDQLDAAWYGASNRAASSRLNTSQDDQFNLPQKATFADWKKVMKFGK